MSDLLIEHRVAGGAKKIQNELNRLGEEVYGPQQEEVLKKLTREGGPISMEDAAAPLQAKINEMRSSKVKDIQPVADAYQERANYLRSLDPKKPEDIIRELPRGMEMGGGSTPISPKIPESIVTGSPTKTIETGFGAVGGPKTIEVPQAMIAGPGRGGPKWDIGAEVPDRPLPQAPLAVIDQTDPTRGPLGQLIDNSGVSAVQANDLKSAAWSNVGPQEWRADSVKRTALGSLSKAEGAGLRQAIENEAQRSLGSQDVQKLKKANDALGRILTTKQQAAMDAAREANSKELGQVKLGVAAADPYAAAMMYLGKAASMTGPKTYFGRALMDAGASGFVDPMVRRALINKYRDENSPWMLFNEGK